MTVTGPEGVHNIQPLPLQVAEARQAFYVQADVARQLGLEDGQVVQANVAIHPNELQLGVKGHWLSFTAVPIWLKNNEAIFLKGQKLPTGEWVLKPVSTLSPNQQLAQAAQKMLLSPGWRALLFQPSGLSQWVTLLRSGVSDSEFSKSPYAPLAAALAQQTLTHSNLQPQKLKKILAAQFKSLEAGLAGGDSVSIDEDMRALLRWFVHEREQGDADQSQLDKDLHRALAELDAAQLKAADDWVSRGEINLSFALPWGHREVLEFQIQREPRRGQAHAPPFVINLHTQNPTLGELWLKAVVTPHPNAHMSVGLSLWAAKPETAEKAKNQAIALTDELESSGLKVDTIQVFNATRKDEPQSRAWDRPSGHVVDAKV